jgi:hypothetical protein
MTYDVCPDLGQAQQCGGFGSHFITFAIQPHAKAKQILILTNINNVWGTKCYKN